LALSLDDACSGLLPIAAGLTAGYTHSIVAGTAIDRAIVLWQERHLRLHTALGADHSMHFAWGTLAAVAHPAGCAPRRTARRAATGLVHQAFLLVKFLLTSSEYEIVSAFPTPKGFVDEVQLETSL
jgi:hypothetical protein